MKKYYFNIYLDVYLTKSSITTCRIQINITYEKYNKKLYLIIMKEQNEKFTYT